MAEVLNDVPVLLPVEGKVEGQGLHAPAKAPRLADGHSLAQALPACCEIDPLHDGTSSRFRQNERFFFQFRVP